MLGKCGLAGAGRQNPCVARFGRIADSDPESRDRTSFLLQTRTAWRDVAHRPSALGCRSFTRGGIFSSLTGSACARGRTSRLPALRAGAAARQRNRVRFSVPTPAVRSVAHPRNRTCTGHVSDPRRLAARLASGNAHFADFYSRTLRKDVCNLGADGETIHRLCGSVHRKSTAAVPSTREEHGLWRRPRPGWVAEEEAPPHDRAWGGAVAPTSFPRRPPTDDGRGEVVPSG